ncbi:MAG: glycerophosphodiester phosphodiesterase family protein [Acidimicrobiales bacterium]
MRSVVAIPLAVILMAAACTATDSSSGPIATPRPTSSFVPTPAPTPTAQPTVPTRPPTPDPNVAQQRTAIDDLVGLGFPLNIAKSGGELMGPQSTLFAMSRSVEEGANVLELDVRLSGDGHLVVHTDDTVEATTESTEAVLDLDLEELQLLDNGYWFSGCWPCRDQPDSEYIYRGVRTGEVAPPIGFVADDFAIPTFAQAVQAFPMMPFSIEIKGEGFGGLAVARMLAEEIDSLEIADSVLVVTANDSLLRAFELLAPEVETSPGNEELAGWLLRGEPLEGRHRILQVPPPGGAGALLGQSFWQSIEEAGLEAWVWIADPDTQENLAFYQQLIADGASGIINGRPNEMAAASS